MVSTNKFRAVADKGCVKIINNSTIFNPLLFPIGSSLLVFAIASKLSMKLHIFCIYFK